MPYILSLILLTCAAFFLLLGVISARRSIRLVRHGVRTTGVVAGYRDGGSHEVVNFTDSAGNPRECLLSADRARHSGSQVEVVFDPRDPSNATGVSFIDFWVLPVACLANGGLALGFGLLAVGRVLG